MYLQRSYFLPGMEIGYEDELIKLPGKEIVKCSIRKAATGGFGVIEEKTWGLWGVAGLSRQRPYHCTSLRPNVAAP